MPEQFVVKAAGYCDACAEVGEGPTDSTVRVKASHELLDLCKKHARMIAEQLMNVTSAEVTNVERNQG